MRLHVLVACVALALPASAIGDDKTPTDKTPTDKTTTDKDKDKAKTTTKLSDAEISILAHVHHVNQMEIDMGKLAQQKGTSAVKRYGEQLVKDHMANDKDVIAFAKKRGVAKLPADVPATEADKAEHKQMMEDMAKLKTLKGADFDRDFVNLMVAGHDKELTKLDTALAQASDTELQDMLRSMKPVLQRHADTARDLQKGNAQAIR